VLDLPLALDGRRSRRLASYPRGAPFSCPEVGVGCAGCYAASPLPAGPCCYLLLQSRLSKGTASTAARREPPHRWQASERGSPQGATVSPLLANLFLHYAFDLWVQWWRQKQARGDVVAVRYADDVVLGFEHEDEARRFLAELQERFKRFGLELHPEKTRLIEFGRYATARRKWHGLDGAPETFKFLGFLHLCGRSRAGRFLLTRHTDPKRMRATLHRRYVHHPPAVARALGSTQMLPNGNVLVGWGTSPYFSEHTDGGRVVFDARLPQGGENYRVLRFPWSGHPYYPPVAKARRHAAGHLLHVSWNGATEVAQWQLEYGPTPDEVAPQRAVPRSHFETRIQVPAGAGYARATALNANGEPLRSSNVVPLE